MSDFDVFYPAGAIGPPPDTLMGANKHYVPPRDMIWLTSEGTPISSLAWMESYTIDVHAKDWWHPIRQTLRYEPVYHYYSRKWYDETTVDQLYKWIDENKEVFRLQPDLHPVFHGAEWRPLGSVDDRFEHLEKRERDDAVKKGLVVLADPCKLPPPTSSPPTAMLRLLVASPKIDPDKEYVFVSDGFDDDDETTTTSVNEDEGGVSSKNHIAPAGSTSWELITKLK